MHFIEIISKVYIPSDVQSAATLCTFAIHARLHNGAKYAIHIPQRLRVSVGRSFVRSFVCGFEPSIGAFIRERKGN